MSTESLSPTEEQLEETPSTAPVTEEKSSKKKIKADLGDKLAKETKKLTEDLQAEKDKYLRIAAEYDNFRKRSQKERETTYGDVRSDTVTRFLPVYDNLERALKQETTDEAFAKGVEMIMQQFIEVMTKLGVSEIEAASGTSFDPELHNAVMHIEDENFGEGVIAEEFQKGFKLGDKVIRFSVVKVAN